jgi:galactonate dehydratase
MKITQVETHAAPLTGRDSLIVRVHTDEGLVGLGEAYPVGPNEAVAATIRDFQSWIAGRDPRDVNGIWYHLYAHSRFPGGSVVNAAISGIEHALWDIAGKAAGVPVYRLLGGKCRDRIRVYQSCSGATPEAIAAHARQLVDQYGYTALKMAPHPPNSDQLPWAAVVRQAGERLAAVREAVGPDVDIGLDPHARIFEPMRALEMAAAVQPYHPFFFEEPLRPENIDALAWLAQKSDVPIATGEMLYTSFGFRELLAKQAATIIQPDICICGGLLEMRKIAAIAEAHYVTVAPHNPLGPVATAVNVQFAAATHNFKILEYVNPVESGGHVWVDDPYLPIDGYLELRDRPGLGIDIDEEAMNRAHYQHWQRTCPVRPDGATGYI